MSGLIRIRKEFKDLLNGPITCCSAMSVSLFDDNDITNWKVSMLGPKDTSYKGGLFYLSVHFPTDYPKKAPEICFITPIYHVNVNPRAPSFPGAESLGHISLSTLNWWKEEYTMREVLTNIFALFYLANPDSPYGLDRADEFRNNRALYEEKVRKYTEQYANPLKGFIMYPKDQDWVFN